MNSMRLRSLPLLTALAIAIAARVGAAPPAPVNAAETYRDAFAWWTSAIGGDEPALTHAEQMAIADPIRGAPTAAHRSAYAKIGPYLERVRAATSVGECSWGTDFNQGFSVLLPQLSDLRTAARALRFDAEMRVAAGDIAGAVDALGSLSGIAVHARSEGFLVSSLVSGAVAMVQERGIDHLLGSTPLGADEAAALLATLDRYDPKDPIGLLGTMATERDVARRTLERAFSGEEGADELSDLLDPAADERFRGLDDENWRQEVARADAAYEGLERIVAMEDRDAARAEIARLSDQVDAGEFGPLAQLLMPAMGRVMETNWRIADTLAARRAGLAGIRDGTIDAAAFTNAAYAYLRLASLGAGIPVEAQERIEAARVASTALDESARTEAREDLAPLRARLRREFALAGRAGRCDFDAAIGQGAVYLSPYLPGLRAAVRAHLADALLGSDPDATSRPAALESALVLVGHLSADPRIGHSLVASSVLAEVADAFALCAEERSIDDAARARLGALVAALPRDDVLGFRAAVAKDRERLLSRIAFGSDPAGVRAALEGLAARQGGDSLTGWLLLLQLSDERGSEAFEIGAAAERPRRWISEVLAQPLAGYDDLVDATALERAVAALPRWRDLMQSLYRPHESNGAPEKDAWSKRLAALGVEPAIDLSIRALAAGPLLTRLDELLGAAAAAGDATGVK